MSYLIDSLESRRLLAFDIVNTISAVYTGGRFVIDSNPAQVAVPTTFKVSKTGTLFISGTGRADTFLLSVRNGRIVGGSQFALEVDPTKHESLGGTVRVSPAGSTDSKVYQLIDVAQLPRIRRISIDALGGDDRITVAADVPVVVRGARGNDEISVFAKNRTIVGGSGNNVIRDGDDSKVDFPALAFTSPIAIRRPIDGVVG